MELDVLTQRSTHAPAIGPKRPSRLPARRYGYAAVRVSETFQASPERVFDAWLDPEIAGRWLFATASRPMTSVRIDARAGGAFRFMERNDGAHIEHTGVYIEVDRPRRLVFSLSAGDGLPVTRVIAEIASRGFSSTDLTILHGNVPGEHAARIGARWTGMLYGLALLLNRT